METEALVIILHLFIRVVGKRPFVAMLYLFICQAWFPASSPTPITSLVHDVSKRCYAYLRYNVFQITICNRLPALFLTVVA